MGVVVCGYPRLFRRGVAETLSVAGDVEVVGETATHEEAVAAATEARPGVVLLDSEMPGAGAEESLRRMLALPPPPRVVVFAMHDEPGTVRCFFERSATSYRAKSVLTDGLAQAVRSSPTALEPSGERPELEILGNEGQHE